MQLVISRYGRAVLTVHEKASRTQDAKVKLPQRPEIMHHRKRTRCMSEIGGDGEIGNDQQAQDQKGADAHRPAKAHLRQQMLYHQRENDAAQ